MKTLVPYVSLLPLACCPDDFVLRRVAAMDGRIVAERTTTRARWRHHCRQTNPPYSPEASLLNSRLLFDACKGGDTQGALWCLAHGADVNWANPEADGKIK